MTGTSAARISVTGARFLVVSLALMFWLVLNAACPSLARAYPQYIGKGDINCSTCHYSPTGGGLINGWGRSSRDASYDFGDPEEFPGHNDVTGFDGSGKPVLEFDVGGDGRLLPLVAGGDGPSSAVVAPMLLEVGGVVAYGNWLAYGTITPRKGPPSAQILPFSREHWLGYTLTEGLIARAGRLVLPFGIRQPDHTQYAREDFGFDKWDQSYAFELDWFLDDLSISGAGFLGDLSKPKDVRASGGVLRAKYLLFDTLELGVSGLASRSLAKDRMAESVFTRIGLPASTYVMGEFATQQIKLRRLNEQYTTQAAYLRAGWFALPALDIFTEAGWRQVSQSTDLDKVRLAVGANWQALHWFEFIPELLAERQPLVGTQYVAMMQLHLLY